MKQFDRQKVTMPWDRISHYPGSSAGTGDAADTPGELYWIPVSSSNVDAISWNESADYKLWVRFKDKNDGRGMAVYAYDVDEDVYDEMFSASSMGRFVHYRLANVPYRQVY